MDPKERVLRTIRYQCPDKPVKTMDTGAVDGFEGPMMKVFEEKTGHSIPADYYNYDIRHVDFKLDPATEDFSQYFIELPEKAEVNEFGVAQIKSDVFPLGKFISPLQSINSVESIEDYPWPSYSGKGLREQVKKLHEQGYAVSGFGNSFYELSWRIRGMQNFFLDLIDRHDIVESLLNNIGRVNLQIACKMAEADVDILCVYDDIAGQDGLLISKQMWSRWFKPRWEEVFRAARDIKPDIEIMMHSCGNVTSLIDDYIKIGVSILNPVQPEVMDIFKLKDKYKERIAFWGGIGTQSIMHRGKPGEVKERVIELANAFNGQGGLIICPANVLSRDIPWENVQAFIEAIDYLRKK